MEAATLGSASRVRPLIVIAVAAFWLLSGCAGTSRRADDPRSMDVPSGFATATPSEAGPLAPYGPDPAPARPSFGPEPVRTRPIVLVLGSGLARGFAYAGALRALSDARIPIGAIYGTEMGALVGTLYGVSGSINTFEFSLLKFRNDQFVEKDLLDRIFRKKGQAMSGEKLENALSSSLGGKDLSQSRIPLRVVIQPVGESAPLVLERGDAVAALRAAMAVPGFYRPGQWDGRPAEAARGARAFAVSDALAMRAGPVIVIDAGERAADADWVKDADLVIRPDLKGIGAFDFDKRTTASFKGKKAVVASLPRIRQLVGIAEPTGVAP